MELELRQFNDTETKESHNSDEKRNPREATIETMYTSHRESGDDFIKKGYSEQPYSFSFMNYDKNVTAKDLEIIKLAAAFCVANDNSDYLTKMKENFKGNSNLSFLDSNHVLNGLFLQFLNQYKHVKRNILGPPMLYLKKNDDFKNVILRRSFQRAEYQEYKNELKNEKDKIVHQYKVQFSAYDWTDFKILENITLPSNTDLDVTFPKPLDFSELALKRISQKDQSALSHLFSTESRGKNDSSKLAQSKKRKLKAAGETRLKKRVVTASPANPTTRLVKCPMTEKMIPEDKFDNHLKILLSDPHYKVQREKYEAKHQLSNLTTNEVYENIKKIAKKTLS